MQKNFNQQGAEFAALSHVSLQAGNYADQQQKKQEANNGGRYCQYEKLQWGVTCFPLKTA